MPEFRFYSSVVGKKKKKKAIKKLRKLGIDVPNKVKTSCCKKFKKGENKRCKKCPCFDLIKKVA
ncbi:hypothetical protein GCM10023311_13550 [Flaviramulus aquimarinus]|uniref:Uncharacterized protein n=1 Tax=Flaviramulus aquimarinus TaxID=1170456 RepID=A0ABP9F2B2_9FLAO